MTGEPIQLLLLMLIFMGCTSYMKINIVLSLIKNALGTQSTPNTLIVSLLSLILTGIIMEPIINSVASRASQNSFEYKKILEDKSEREKLLNILQPYYEFLNSHSSESTKILFEDLRKKRGLSTDGGYSWSSILPAFVLTELKDAFRMGILLLLPFLIIDIVICNVLAGMGMHMVNPLTIGLPLKLLLFFSADCWTMLMKALVLSYGVS